MSRIECFETRLDVRDSHVCSIIMVLDGAELDAWYRFLKDRSVGFRAVIEGTGIAIGPMAPEGAPCGDASS